MFNNLKIIYMKKSIKRKFAEYISIIPTEIDEKLNEAEATATTKAILGVCISLHIQQNADVQGYFFASYMAIGETLEIDTYSVSKCLAVLQQINLITLVEKGGMVDGKRVANRWNLTFNVKCDEQQQKTISIKEYNDMIAEIGALSLRLKEITDMLLAKSKKLAI